MGRTCGLCRGPAAADSCFVRVTTVEQPACRACWEQLFLDPRRFISSLKDAPPDRSLPPHPTRN